LLIETGFDLDRAWMVVDTAGELVTQRELPRMALIRPTLKGDELVLRAPGMLALHISLGRVEAPCKATVWNDTVAAYDMGALAAQWFSDFLGQPLRLARFDPEQKRLADRRWTGEIEAETSFQDGFPLLVTSTAGLAATYGDKVEGKGFQLGAVTNSSSSYEDSVVMFKRGHKPEARKVAKQLSISDLELMSGEIEAVAAGANVAVIVGEDNAAAAG
jgi:uncharacterized protein YcbX